MRNRYFKKNNDTAKPIIGRSYRDVKKANHYTDYTVDEPCELLDFLLKKVTGMNRTKAKGMLSQKKVYINHVCVSQYNTPLEKGQIVQICDKRATGALNNKYVKIVYEDAFLIVVEKSIGILTNSPLGEHHSSVKAILDNYVKRTNKRFTVRTVHRLDRETSGLLVFAKRPDVQIAFVEHWKEMMHDRRYIAVVEGVMEKDSDKVESWLSDNRMFVSYSTEEESEGKHAVTNYKTIRRGENASLVELKLDTGRKNQIRVHMHDIGHPIVGDRKYGSAVDPIGRICLHAFRLEFVHPVTGELLSFETPYPDKFVKLVNSKN